MSTKIWTVPVLGLAAVGMFAGWSAMASGGGGLDLSASKHSLEDGIRQAAKAPEVAISAKFELDDNGKLSLSVYTAEKGLAVDAEHNVLKELPGNPEAEKWAHETEVFKDVEHVPGPPNS